MSTMDMAIFEGSDYFLDMETSSYNKKRRWGGALVTAQDNNADEDYVSFLDGLQQLWEAKFVEDDDADPTYMEFLGNLKEYETAYMCDASIENGVLETIYYEFDPPNPKKRKSSQPHNGTGIHKKNSGLKSSRKSDVFPWSLDVAENQKSARKNSKAGNVLPDVSKRKTPVSCMDDRVKENRSLHMVRDQKSSDFRNDHHDGIKRSTPNSRQVDHLGENRSSDTGSDQNNPDSENDFSHGFKQKPPHSSKSDSVRSLAVDSDHILNPKYSGFGKKTSIVVDETYQKFLDSLQFTGDTVFYKNGDQDRIFYEPTDNQTTGFKIKKYTRPPSSTLRPSTPIPRPQTPPSRTRITSHKNSTSTDSHNILSSSNETCKIGKERRVSSSSYWKKKLHDYLRKPYSRKEHKKIWAELSIKTPVSIYRDSRSGGSYRPGHMGKSLLEQHPDLQREIEKVQSNPHKVLNLLRMCKFYVQKIPAIPSGVCAPWKDDLTMNILPRSS